MQFPIAVALELGTVGLQLLLEIIKTIQDKGELPTAVDMGEQFELPYMAEVLAKEMEKRGVEWPPATTEGDGTGG